MQTGKEMCKWREAEVVDVRRPAPDDTQVLVSFRVPDGGVWMNKSSINATCSKHLHFISFLVSLHLRFITHRHPLFAVLVESSRKWISRTNASVFL